MNRILTHSRHCVRIMLVAAAMVFCLVSRSAPTGAAETSVVAGWAETVRIYPGGVLINAKLDSGANTSSLHVRKPAIYKRNGQDWIKFEFRNRRNVTTLIDRPIVRIARIKEAGGVLQQRPVITIGICLGDIKTAKC